MFDRQPRILMLAKAVEFRGSRCIYVLIKAAKLVSLAAFCFILVLLSTSVARADAFADAAVTLDLSPFIFDIDGLDVFGLGTHSGFKFESGNAVAAEHDALTSGDVLGSTGPPSGVAGGMATGTINYTLTNEFPATVLGFNLDISFDYGATTSVDGPNDSARAAVIIDGSTESGPFSLANFIIKGNDHKADSNDEFNLLPQQLSLAPGASYNLTLHYEVDALAITAPEPSTLSLLGLSLGVILWVRMRTRSRSGP